jgi:hypothetical protein
VQTQDGEIEKIVDEQALYQLDYVCTCVEVVNTLAPRAMTYKDKDDFYICHYLLHF